MAARVLVRVWNDGAWAAPTLDAELSRSAELEPRDAGLATELVYGVLRTLPVLERELDARASSDRWKKTPRLRAHLAIATYTILFLDRVPPFAAVSEAVEAVKRFGGKKVGGFANAVLRRVAEAAEKAPRGHEALAEASRASLPGWLRRALRRALGDELEAFLAGDEPPPLCLCLAAGEDRAAHVEALRAARPGARVEPGELSPRAIRLWGAGHQRRLPGAAEGAFDVQEEGAQALALMVGAGPGEAVLDACAGRGNKSLLLAEAVGAEGAVDAADLHPNKLARLAEEPAGRPKPRHTFAVDWTRGRGGATGPYDPILVDAPCSGVGTLQRRIVTQVAPLLRVEGRLVYAVCSVLEAEAEEVIAALTAGPLEGGVELASVPFDGAFARGVAGEATSLRLLPGRHGTDGYFVASLKRVR